MNALLYIIGKSIKNSLLELRKNPGKIILYLIIISLLVMVITTSFTTRSIIDTPSPIFWFKGVLFLFISLSLVISIKNSLSSGDAIFEMNDVNLLFVSPVSSRKILLYGLVRMVKTAFLAGFFILFQSALLANFGFGYGGVLLTFAGYIISVIILTVCSLLIYTITNGNALRKKIVKFSAIALFVPLAVFLAIQYFKTFDIFLSLETAIKSPFLHFVPVAGWMAGAVTSFLSGELLNGIFFLGLNLILAAGCAMYILFTNPDYYEDVLVATETIFEKKRAISEGSINSSTLTDRKIKVTKTGIFGTGAVSIFGKHIRESFRESRFGFLTLSSGLIVISAVIASFFIRDLFTIMFILMWIQIIKIGTGRGLKETYTHYIYMIPESSFKKIIWSNMEVIAKTLTESILIFGITGIVINSVNPVFVFTIIITYTLFSFLLLGINYLFMRITKADISAGLLLMIYYLAVILIMAPGIVLAFLSSFLFTGNLSNYFMLFVLSVWELTAGVICFIFSKDILHNCDMQIVKTGK